MFLWLGQQGCPVIAVLLLTVNYLGQSAVLLVKLILPTLHWVPAVRRYSRLPAIMSGLGISGCEYHLHFICRLYL